MKFSFIIPTLNEEKLLPNLIKKLNENELRKKYDYEIIISDGGSSDRTIEIGMELADKVVIHTDESEQNIAQGRNRGAEKSCGDILIFMNGDINISDTQKFFETIEKDFINSKFLAMTFPVFIIKNEEKFSDKVMLGFYNRYFHFLNFIGMGMGRGECQVIRRKTFYEENGYKEHLAAGEDFDLFKRVRKKGKILFSWKVIIFESPRRYRKYGHARIFFKWLFNSILVVVRNRSASKEWEQVR